MNALNEHIAFSTHYTHQGEQLEEEEEDELLPLGTMQDSLQVKQVLLLLIFVKELHHLRFNIQEQFHVCW